jgi:hypothetical protein
MAERAADLVDHDFPPPPVRQWVVAIPNGCADETTALQGGRAKDALLAVADTSFSVTRPFKARCCAFSSPQWNTACVTFRLRSTDFPKQRYSFKAFRLSQQGEGHA